MSVGWGAWSEYILWNDILSMSLYGFMLKSQIHGGMGMKVYYYVSPFAIYDEMHTINYV